MTRRATPKSVHFKLRIGPSEIHRWGVFAREDIPAGRRVIEYAGKRLTWSQGKDLKPPKDNYLVGLNDKWLLDGRVGGTGAEFINHSCTPNLIFRRVAGHIFFYSSRKIRAGEELTVRYGYPVKITRVLCRCGSRRGRGTLRYLLR
jgi:SET domain-containing protein